MSGRPTRDSVFGWFAAVVARHPAIVLACSAVLGLAALWSAVRIEPATGIQDMLADNQPAAVALARTVNRFTLIDDLILIVRRPEGAEADPDALLAFAERLGAELAEEPTVASYRYRQSAEMRRFVTELMVPAGLWYLDEAQRDALRERLSREAMQAQFEQNAAMLAAPGPAATGLAKQLIRDPLRLREFLSDAAGGGASPFKTMPGTDAMISADGQALMVRISGRESANNLEFTADFMPRVRAAVERAAPDELRVDYTGGYAIAEHSAAQTQSDMARSCIWSILLLVVFFAWVFRNPLTFPLLMLPVAVAILVSFGLFAAVSGRLTPVTGVAGAVLAGLGIDYCVHYLSHYEDQRRDKSAEDAVVRTTQAIGPAIVAACLTTVIGFAAVFMASIHSLREFSLLGVLGLLAAMLASLTALPAMLVLLNRLRWGRRTWAASRVNLRPMVRVIAEHRRLSAVPLAVLSLGCVGVLLAFAVERDGLHWPVGFDTDLTALHPRPHPPLDSQQLVVRYFGATPDALLIHLNADSHDAMLRLAHRVQIRLDQPDLDRLGIGTVLGPATVLPHPDLPPPKAFPIDTILSDFDAAADRAGFNAERFADYRAFLSELVQPGESPTAKDVWQYPEVAGAVLPVHEPRPADGLVLATLLEPWDSVPQRDAGIEAIRGALAMLPGATLTGLPVVGYDTQRAVGDELSRLLGVAGLMVFVWLLIFFRRPTHVLLALVPAGVGVAMLLAIMAVFDLRFNAVNLVAAPLLVGIGVDDGIFLTAIYRRVRLAGLDRQTLITDLASSAQAVVMTSVTTALAFGSLVFTHVPAIRSLGLLTALGVGCALIATLLGLLPILVSLRIRQTRHAPPPASDS